MVATPEPTVTVVDTDTGEETQVHDMEADTSINVKIPDTEGLPALDDFEIVDDNDPRLNENQGQGMPNSGPNVPNSHPDPNSEAAQLLAELRQERQQLKEQRELDAKIAEASEKAKEFEDKYMELGKEKMKLLQNPRYVSKNGGMTPEGSAKFVNIDAQMNEVQLEFVNQKKEVERLRAPAGGGDKPDVPQAAKDFINAEAHWLQDPMYAQARTAANQVAEQYEQQGYKPDNKQFWDAVKKSVINMGYELPDGNLNNGSGPPIIHNVGGSASGANPNARRQTSAPTTGVGQRSKTSPNTGKTESLSKAELALAKEFGNDSGERLQALKRQLGK